MSFNTDYSYKLTAQNDLEIAANGGSTTISDICHPGNVTIQSVATKATVQKISNVVCKGDLVLSQTSTSSQPQKVQASILPETAQNKIVRCARCNIYDCHLPGGSKLKSLSKEGVIFLDPAGKLHEVMELGEYKLIDMGGGYLFVQRIGDHVHKENS